MGLYNTYHGHKFQLTNEEAYSDFGFDPLNNLKGGVQLKASEHLNCKHYYLGDVVDLEDGVYLDMHGVVVVQNRKLVMVEKISIFNKSGNSLNLVEVMKPHDPATKQFEQIVRNLKNET